MTDLAALIAEITPGVLRSVLKSGHRLDPTLAAALRSRDRVTRGDRKTVHRGLSSLLRWWGWIEPLHLVRVEDQLTVGLLLDRPGIEPVCRVWGTKTGQASDRWLAVGDAPGWTARAEGLKRWAGERAVNADPWRLFPEWLRDRFPLPPGDAPAKSRKLAFLQALQARPSVWVGLRGGSEKLVWNELREAGAKPWVHRRLTSAARLEPDVDLSAVRAFQEGELVIEDLSSQAVGKVCDPDPGERWWDVRGGAGLQSLHLASLMGGKGTVIATFENDRLRHETAVRLRKGKFRNIAAKVWDGRHAPGKAASFDGVLLEAPGSGIGTWRRHPEARWMIKESDLPALAARQKELLEVAASAVRPGGTLVYTVATATLAETQQVVAEFLAGHPEFALDPFPHPLEESATAGTLQIWPQLHDTEARFIARMVRRPAPRPPVE